MLSKKETNKIKQGLKKELGNTIKANECGLSTNDFSESINILEGALNYIEELEQNEKRLKDRLENDVIKITKTLQDGKHCDDYSRCRLKAYRTKTKEILRLMEG